MACTPRCCVESMRPVVLRLTQDGTEEADPGAKRRPRSGGVAGPGPQVHPLEDVTMSDVVLYIAAWAETWKASLSDALVYDGESGQGMVEYGLILALVSVAAIAALVVMGPKIASVFNGVNTSLQSIPPTPTAV